MFLKQYRVAALTIVFMLIINAVFPFILSNASKNASYGVVSQKVFENNFRFGEKVDKIVLDAFIYHIKKQDGYKVVFIGDSVIAGATVKNNSDTIPAFFQEIASKKFPGKKIRTYNLALPGSRPSDIYFTLKKLHMSKAADLIIMNVNYAFYSDEMVNQNTVARPENFADVMEYDSSKKLRLKTSFIENWIISSILSKTNIYNMREELSFYLFGNNPREELTSFDITKFKVKKENPLFLPQVELRNNPDKTWVQNMPFPESKLKHWEKALDIKEMDESNISYWFLEKTNSFIKQNNIKAAGFLTPENKALIQKFKLIKNMNMYNNNRLIIKNAFNEYKIPFFDYSYSIDSDYFHELFHMCAPGNKLLASAIFKDVESLIAEDINQ